SICALLAVDECAPLVPQRALDLRDVRHLTAEQDRLHGLVARLELCRLYEYLLRFRRSDDRDSVGVGDDDVAGVDDDSAARDRHVDLAGAWVLPMTVVTPRANEGKTFCWIQLASREL